MPVIPPTSRSQKSLLSRTSLLIVSAFLVGWLAQRILPTSFEAYALYAVVAVSAVALGISRFFEYRRKRAAEFAQQQAEWLLEHRMSKHLSLHHSPRPKFTQTSDWQQYVNVPSGK